MLLVMKMDKALMGKDIPVAVLRNNYINGVDKYNYEKFMVDFINNSKLVDEKEGTPFYHQEEQSNSEADAFTIKKSKVIQRQTHLMDFMILILKSYVNQNKCMLVQLLVFVFLRLKKGIQLIR